MKFASLVCALLLVTGCGGSRNSGPPPNGMGPGGGYGGPGPGPGPHGGAGTSEIKKRPDGSCVRYDHPNCPPGGTCDPSVPTPVACPPGM